MVMRVMLGSLKKAGCSCLAQVDMPKKRGVGLTEAFGEESMCCPNTQLAVQTGHRNAVLAPCHRPNHCQYLNTVQVGNCQSLKETTISFGLLLSLTTLTTSIPRVHSLKHGKRTGNALTHSMRSHSG